MTSKLRLSLFACALLVAAGCGGKDDVPLDGDGSPIGGDGGGGGGTPDAVVGGSCGADKPQCNNCLDDDADGLADGFDPECTGVEDNDEGSFATGIPGDNKDDKKQDCFFDGNSGGNCQVDTCCLFAEGACPIGDTPSDCSFGLACIEECLPLVPPGCDCFGCCTICVEAGCFDVLTNPAVAPDCSQETVGTDACPICQKFTDCTAEPCDASPTDCVLCPGEDPADLPVECNGENTCPAGVTACTSGGSECSDTQYCQNGCCVFAVP